MRNAGRTGRILVGWIYLLLAGSIGTAESARADAAARAAVHAGATREEAASATEPGNPQRPRHRLLFRGRPQEACDAFLITELGYSRYFIGGPGEYGNWSITAHVGAMANLDWRSAAGLTGFINADDQGNRLGVQARYRQWLLRPDGRVGPVSVEAAGGLFVAGRDFYDWVLVGYDASSQVPLFRERRIQYPSPLLSLALNAGDWISVVAQIEWIRLDWGDDAIDLTGGVRAGSYLGVVSAAALTSWIVYALSRFE